MIHAPVGGPGLVNLPGPGNDSPTIRLLRCPGARPLAFLLAMLFAVLLTPTAFAQGTPKKYQALYRDLDAQLATLDLRVPAAQTGKVPIRAATLLSANCHRGKPSPVVMIALGSTAV